MSDRLLTLAGVLAVLSIVVLFWGENPDPEGTAAILGVGDHDFESLNEMMRPHKH